MLVIGVSSTTITANDPGRSQANRGVADHRAFPIASFLDAWAHQRFAGIEVIGSTNTPPAPTPTPTPTPPPTPPPPSGDFGLSVSPASQTVTQGSSVTYSVSITSNNGFSGSISLNALNLPGKVLQGTGFQPDTVTVAANATASSKFVFVADTSTPTGTASITFQGTSGTVSRSTTGALTVSSSPKPTLTVNGVTDSSRQIGQTFLFVASGFSPGKSVNRSVSPPVSGGLDPVTANSSGQITWTFAPTCGQPYAAYEYTATEAGTNNPSNSVFARVLSSTQAGFTLATVTPAQIARGTFDMTLNGTGFDLTAIDQIFWKQDGHFVGNGAIKSRSTTQIVVTQSMGTAVAGTYQVSVKNCDMESTKKDFILQ